MHILNLIEDSFDELSIKTKIELFVFPLLVLLLIWNLFFNDIKFVEELSQKKFDTNNLQMKTDIIDIISDIREFCSDRKIKLEYLEGKDRYIDLKVKAKNEKLFLLIKYIEQYNSFSSIDYLKKENQFLELKVSFNSLYLKRESTFDFKTELIEENERKKDEKVLKHFKLEAIVGENVYLNKKWYQKDQIVDNFTLTRVGSNYILLSNGFIKIEVRLYENDEY